MFLIAKKTVEFNQDSNCLSYQLQLVDPFVLTFGWPLGVLHPSLYAPMLRQFYHLLSLEYEIQHYSWWNVFCVRFLWKLVVIRSFLLGFHAGETRDVIRLLGEDRCNLLLVFQRNLYAVLSVEVLLLMLP